MMDVNIVFAVGTFLTVTIFIFGVLIVENITDEFYIKIQNLVVY